MAGLGLEIGPGFRVSNLVGSLELGLVLG